MKPKQGEWYDYPQYYEMTFVEDTPVEVAFFEAAFKKYCDFPVQRLLEPGCGSGRLVVEMARRGYDVTGFDLSQPSLDYLQTRLSDLELSATVFHGDMTDFQLDEPVDAAFNTWNTFRHLLTEDDARAHLQCVSHQLRPGGIYILGFHLLPLDVDEESTEQWTSREGETTVTTRLHVTASDRANRREDMRVNLRVRGTDVNLKLRHDFVFRMYTADEFRQTLQSVPQLKLLDVYDFWYDIDEPLKFDDEITDTLFILQRVE